MGFTEWATRRLLQLPTGGPPQGCEDVSGEKACVSLWDRTD